MPSRSNQIPRTIWGTDFCCVIKPAVIGYRWALYDVRPNELTSIGYFNPRIGAQRFRGWAPTPLLAIHASQAYINRRRNHHIVNVTAHRRSTHVHHDSKNIG